MCVCNMFLNLHEHEHDFEMPLLEFVTQIEAK